MLVPPAPAMLLVVTAGERTERVLLPLGGEARVPIARDEGGIRIRSIRNDEVILRRKTPAGRPTEGAEPDEGIPRFKNIWVIVAGPARYELTEQELGAAESM